VIADAPAATEHVPYAGIVTRAVGFVIDILIVNAVVFSGALVVGLVIEAFGTFAPHLNLGSVALSAGVWSLAFAIYFTTWWSLTGQTPGMRAMGIKVVPTEGGRLRPRRGIVRVVGMALAAIPFFAGYFLILVQSRRQGLQDLLARTLVLYVDDDRPRPPYRGGAGVAAGSLKDGQ
jgi:uncharacterized RDD family membrane protein YckC